MSNTIPLPDGGSATFRDAAVITEAQRRPVTRLQMRMAGTTVGRLLQSKPADPKDDDTVELKAERKAWDEQWTIAIGNPDELDLFNDLNDAMAVALVDRVDIPTKDDAGNVNGIQTITDLTVDKLLNDLPARAYDAIRTEAAKHIADLLPNFSDPTADASSPT